MKTAKTFVKVGAGVVIVSDGKTLMTKRKSVLGSGTYGTVGGHVEYGETPQEAVKREAREELGIELGNLRFLCCSNLMIDGKHYVDITFTGDIISGQPTIQEPESIESVGWYDLNDLPQPLFGPLYACYEAYKTGQNYFELQ